MSKKITALLLAILLLITLTIGCAKTELEFFDLMNEIDEIESKEVTFEASFIYEREDNFHTFYDEEPLKTEFEIDFRFTQRSCSKELKYHTFIEIKTDEEYKPLTELILKDSNFYIRVDTLLDSLEDFYHDEYYRIQISEMKDILGDTKYINYYDEELLEIAKIFETSDNKMSLDLFKKAFDTYQSGAFSKDGDDIVIRIDLDNVYEIIYNTVLYIVENVDHVEETFKSAIEKQKSEIDSTGMLDQITNMLVDEIDEMASVIREDSESILLITVFLGEAFEQMKEIYGDTMLEYRIRKEKDDTYKGKAELLVDFDDDFDKIFIRFLSSYTIKELPDFEIELPDQKDIINLDELEEKILTSESHVSYLIQDSLMNLNGKEEKTIELAIGTNEILIIEDDVYFINYLDAPPRMIDATTFIPVRALEYLDIEVGFFNNTATLKYDNEIVEINTQTSEVKVNNQRVILDNPAFISEGRTFIPIRFVVENLGFDVQWVGEYQSIIITR